METITNKIYQAALWSIRIISVFLTGVFLLSGLLFTCYSSDMGTQEVLKKQDNLLICLPAMVLFLIIIAAVTYAVCRFPKNGKRLLLFLVLGWCILPGIILILFGRTIPAADSASVYTIAESLAAGDTGVIHPTDSYLSFYPQQIGLVAFYEGIIRLWKWIPLDIPAYHFIKCLNILFACAIIYFTSRTVDLLFDNDRITCCYLALAGGNLPLIFYTSFIYGEIPSFGLFTAGVYFLCLFLKRGPLITMPIKSGFVGVFSIFLFTGSVLLRKNSLILVIAVLLVLFFQWIKTKRHSLLLLAAVCLVYCIGILPLTRLIYENRANNTLKDGVPAISYLAMGMQESSRGNGWYNGFNFNTYQENAMDADLTSRISEQAIRERITVFQKNPGYAASFYGNKYLSQWTDGTYACRQASLASWGRSKILEEIYDGDYSKYLIGYCNIYQSILYLGAFLFCLIAPKKKMSAFSLSELPVYLGLIGVTGGFLFHMFWEANSRYILPYGLLLLPYAACGLYWLTNYCSEKAKKRLHKQA